MRIAIIGAGMAGLCAAYQSVEYGFDATVYEQTKEIGGTWVLSDEVGTDEYSLDIHSSMYEGLFTNSAKENMGYPNFPFPEQEKSYLPSKDVLNYLQSYANKFEINKLIKFQHYVIRVAPKGESQWEIIVRDLPNDKVLTEIFDAVLICNGHAHDPIYPKIEGMNMFSGKQMHSHDFRNTNVFKDEQVLVIGAGGSGIDISTDISKVSKQLTLSHHIDDDILTKFNGNSRDFLPRIKQKPDVKRLTENGAEFIDGTFENYSIIVYCTGYKYSFPFLSLDSGITVDDNYVHPLYKHCININGPTLGFIGIPVFVCYAQLFDLQARFCLTFFSGRKELPSRNEMLKDTMTEMKMRWEKCNKKSKSHVMGEDQQNYYDALASIAETEKIKPVMVKLEFESIRRLITDFDNFRNDIYKIIDDNTFIRLN